jgi:hypothetical protein
MSASVASALALAFVSVTFAQTSGQQEDESQMWSRTDDSLRQERSDKPALDARRLAELQRALIAQYAFGRGNGG